MKKKMFLPIVALISVGMLAGCNTNPSSSSPATSTSTPAASSTSQGLVLTSLSITNKTDLQKTWNTGDDTRTIEITADPTQNITSLITTGKLAITSSDPTVVTAVGKVLYAQKHGTTTITIACGGQTDTVDIEITDKVTLTPTENVLDVAGTTHFEIASTSTETTATAASSYTWTSSDTAVATVDATGTVTGVAAGTTTIKAALTAGPKTFSEYEITVKAGGEKYVAISTMTYANKAYIVKGTVGGTNSVGFMLDDGTTSVYVYGFTNYAVGDYVKVNGISTVYNNEMEFGATGKLDGSDDKIKTIVTKLIKPDDATTTEATELTIAKATSIKNLNPASNGGRGLFVKYTYKTIATTYNGYDCLNVIDAPVIIEPTKYNGTTKLVTGTYYTVTGYAIGYNSGYKYMDFMVTDLAKADATTLTAPVVALNTYVETVKATETYQLTASVTTAASTDSKTVTWASSDTAKATVDTKGLVTTLVEGTCNITATLGATTVTCKFNITKDISSYSKKAILTSTNLETTTEFTLASVTVNSEHNTEFDFAARTDTTTASVTTNLTNAKIGAIDIEVFGTHDNLKVYAGTDATGTALTHGDTTTGENKGALYTYYADDAASIYIANPSGYKVYVYSITVYYKLAA